MEKTSMKSWTQVNFPTELAHRQEHVFCEQWSQNYFCFVPSTGLSKLASVPAGGAVAAPAAAAGAAAAGAGAPPAAGTLIF